MQRADGQKEIPEIARVPNENEKKRSYLHRAIIVENGNFTPLVFGTNGIMGDECKQFVNNLA